MATKQNIINKVDTDLASGGNIQATDHRGVLHGNSDSIIDNFYGIKQLDTNKPTGNTSNVVTFTDADLSYTVFITKNGTRVNIDGFLYNQKGVIIPANTVFFNITNSEYLMDIFNNGQGYSVRTFGFSSSGGLDFTRISLSGQELRILDPMPIGETSRFSLTYNTQN